MILSLPTMLVDPALAYATQSGPVPPELVQICHLDKTRWDDATARRSYKTILLAAEAGSPFAMCMCCRFCQAGWGREQSNEEALEWAKKADKAGFAPGCFELGNCYEKGIGVPANIDQACDHYKLAVDRGFGFAACHLASLYHSGRLGKQNNSEAVRYATLAYELKDPASPLLMAGWYEDGDGVIRNEKEAVLWYSRAAELGNFIASNRLSRAYELGELGLPRDSELAKKYRLMFDNQLADSEHSRTDYEG